MSQMKLNFPNLSVKLAASAWCKPNTRKIQMDVRLAEEFAKILDREMSKPNLGCATTRQLFRELIARSDLNYSTVFSETTHPPNTKQ